MNKFRTVWLTIVILLNACTARFETNPIPIEKSASLTLKAPVVSKIPLFWIFPINTLTWLAEDWFDTAWFGSPILLNYGTNSRPINLNRFSRVELHSDRTYSITTDNRFSFDPDDSCEDLRESWLECSYKCGPINKQLAECKKPNRSFVDSKWAPKSCQVLLSPKTGHHYEAFVRADEPYVIDVDSGELRKSACTYHWDYLGK